MTEKLNAGQRRAVQAPKGPLLIVAGAGTGKTRTLTERIIHLIQTGVSPEGICALTFTNKAAQEMAERVTNNLGLITKDDPKSRRSFVISQSSPFMGTFHSLGARILRREGALLGRKPNFVIFDDHDALSLVKKILKARQSAAARIKPAMVYGKISAFKNGVLKREELAQENLNGIFEEYEARLESNNAFDFDDLIEKVVRVFRARREVLERYQKKFPYLFVDEYQDINNVQYELVKLLTDQSRNLSVVGDDQQTIYSFRGSNIEIFLNFTRDWPESQTVFLDQNYRSTANIIGAASSVISNNQYQVANKGLVKTQKLWTENEEGKKVRVAEFGDEEEEANWIAQKVSEEGRGKRVAILYRTNAQSRAIEQALLETVQPYVIYGGVKFYERLEVKDVLAALRLYSNPKDEVSRERLEKNIGKRRLFELERMVFTSKNSGPAELIQAFLKTTNYLETIEKNYLNADDRKENIAELISFSGEFEKLTDFLEKVTLLQATDDLSHGPSGDKKKSWPVQMMTIHLAKGLEFDKVFLVGVNEGLLPHHRSMDSLSELEEERRLTYVAMTRARKELALSFYGLPSRFLSEIPEEFVEFENGGRVPLDSEERYITLD